MGAGSAVSTRATDGHYGTRILSKRSVTVNACYATEKAFALEQNCPQGLLSAYIMLRTYGLRTVTCARRHRSSSEARLGRDRGCKSNAHGDIGVELFSSPMR